MKDQSLIDPVTKDYYLADIVNEVLEDNQDGKVTKVSQLDNNQIKLALLVYVKGYKNLNEKIRKLKQTIGKI